MLLALSALQKTGLALSGAAFIVYAVTSSLIVPRFWPEFPGRFLRLFVGVTVLFFIGMLAAVIGFAKESEPKAAEAPTAVSSSGPPPPAGNAAAGKAVFLGPGGCAACHTFAPAGSHSPVGPDLGRLAADAQKANRGPLAAYVRESLLSPDAYTVPGFAKGIMAGSCCKQLDSTQIDDVVAFLTQPS